MPGRRPSPSAADTYGVHLSVVEINADFALAHDVYEPSEERQLRLRPRSLALLKVLRSLLSGNSSIRQFLLQPHPWYWSLRARVGNFISRLRYRAFRLRRRSKRQRESLSVWRQLLRTVSGSVIAALLLAIVLHAVERLMAAPLGAAWQAIWSIDGIRAAIEHFQAWGLAPQRIVLDSNAYFGLLTALAAFAGVFLTLYFATLGLVASSIYAKVQSEVRDLVLRDGVATFYLHVVAFFAMLATLLLGARALGLHPGILNLFVVGGLGIVSILGFVRLGVRLFDLFDPTRLAGRLILEIGESMRSATSDGVYWDIAEYQNHYRREAEAILATYGSIVRLAAREEHLRGHRLAQLATNLLDLLRAYAAQKPRIPTQSYWFPRIQGQGDWLTADDIRVSLALDTDTPLYTEQVPDAFWLEALVIDMVGTAVQALIDADNVRDAAQVGAHVERTLRGMGEELAVEDALRFLRGLRPVYLSLGRTVEVTDLDHDEQAERVGTALALIDIPGWSLIGVLLAVAECIEAITPEVLEIRVASISWRKRREFYMKALPQALVAQVEALDRWLTFERLAEGRIISAPWYRVHVVAAKYLRHISTILEALVKALEEQYAPEAEQLVDEGRPIFAAQHLQRGLEACNKFTHHLSRIQVATAAIDAFRHASNDGWSVVPWESFEQRVTAVRERLLRDYARIAKQLADIPTSRYWPDFFGQAYTVLAQEAYRALATGNQTMFKTAFSAFFLATSDAEARLRARVRDEDVTTAFIFSTEPLETLVHLSGFALIYSELDGGDAWTFTASAWDRYLSGSDGPQRASAICTALEARRSVFSIKPGDINRTRWAQDFDRRLREQGIEDDTYGLPSFLRRDRVRPLHSSSVISALARGAHPLGLGDTARDVFLALYLKRHLPPGAHLPRDAREFRRRVARERALQRGAIEADSAERDSDAPDAGADQVDAGAGDCQEPLEETHSD